MPRAKAQTRDWVFGAAGKRRLLAAVLLGPDRRWTQAQLARAAGLHTKGSADEHIAALVQLGLLADEGKLILRADSPLIEPLRLLLRALDQVPNERVVRP